MLINWFTVGAQVLNFLVLVWLLKHFLYKPILTAIDGREKRIAAELAEADTKKAEAEKEHSEFDGKNKAFDNQREALLAKARDDAKAEHDRLLEEAHKDAEKARAGQTAALQSDLAKLGDELTQLAKKEVFSITRRTLADLATVTLEERMGEVFTRRLHALNGKDKDALGTALRSSSEPSLVRSVFAMPAAQQAAIRNALNESFSAEIRVRFETAPQAVCGIELTASGQKLEWSIAGYLTSFNEKVSALIEIQSALAVKGEPKAKVSPRPESAPNHASVTQAPVHAGVK
jgi:F-type H+-transporting ATPase subunit b